ncbi:MAG TPA: ABC transporter permease subunit [Thermoplasmata archaeon]|nr:ABC transporter permease subunit [Thermoplasmata archaeon]
MTEKIYSPKHYIKEKEWTNFWGVWVVAKREFMALLKSPRMLILGILIFLVCFLSSFIGTLILGGGLLAQTPISQLGVGVSNILLLITIALMMLVPFMASAFSFDNITKERESRSLALLLSKPLTKRCIALGKYLGTVGAMILPIVLALSISIGAVIVLSGDFSLLSQGMKIIAFTLILGASFVGIQQVISTLVKTTRTSMIVGVACLFFFWGLWMLIWLGYAYAMFKSAGIPFTATNIVTSYVDYTTASALEVGFATTPIMPFLYHTLLGSLPGQIPGITLVPLLGLKAYLSLIGWLVVPVVIFMELFNRLAGKE